jgi:hypothetical protein
MATAAFVRMFFLSGCLRMTLRQSPAGCNRNRNGGFFILAAVDFGLTARR